MSYLHLEKGIPDFSKAVISFWFRVTKESIAKAKDSSQDTPPVGMSRTIALLTLGDTPVRDDMEPIGANVGVAVNFDQSRCPYVGSVVGYQVAVPAFVLPPSYIAVNCNEVVPRLEFFLQTAADATQTDTANAVQRVDVYDLAATPPPFPGAPPPVGLANPGSGWTDLGFPFIGHASGMVNFSKADWQPQYFYVATHREIKPDEWHHLLLSFDLTEGCVTRSQTIADAEAGKTIADMTAKYCRMWYALDDENFDGPDNLGSFFVQGGADKNAILTADAWRVADSVTEYMYNLLPPIATYSFLGPLPCRSLGIPASKSCVNNIYNVEMAEFQMWTEVTTDTGIESNRRAFIDFDRDKDGNFILDKDGKKILKPVAPDAAEKLLGKKPEIMLHGSSKWIDGKNTGTTGLDYGADPPTEKPDGQFQVISEIWPYKPDPSRPAA
jgi:hypothetical protein